LPKEKPEDCVVVVIAEDVVVFPKENNGFAAPCVPAVVPLVVVDVDPKDAKKIAALSTTSQIGFCFLDIGSGFVFYLYD
uniref:DUF3700 domain-containing protein n=1 Tax=Brugia timori TaxID=42155 RepID=A0A0R3RCV7_9BILA